MDLLAGRRGQISNRFLKELAEFEEFSP